MFLHWNLKWSWQREPLVIVRTTRKIFKISVKEQKTREGKIGMKAQWQCHEDGHYYSEVWQSGTCQADILVGMLAASLIRHVAFHYWKEAEEKPRKDCSHRPMSCHACLIILGWATSSHCCHAMPCHACLVSCNSEQESISQPSLRREASLIDLKDLMPRPPLNCMT